MSAGADERAILSLAFQAHDAAGRGYLSREQFGAVIGMDHADWQQELKLHDELFAQLAHHLPAELPATKARIEARLSA